MDNKLQELEVLVETVPYLEKQIKAKYQRLNDEYIKAAEKLSRETYGSLAHKIIRPEMAEELAKPIKTKCDLQFGSKEERKKWQEEEIAQLHNTICARTYKLFPELVYTTRLDG